MNAAQKARMEYLRDLSMMEVEANIDAHMKAASYVCDFERACEKREIRAAAERAWFQNMFLPMIKAAGRNSRAVREHAVA